MSERLPAKVLSCASCRQRKIKCDKVQPVCTQCSRVGLECVFPSRKPTRRVARPRQSELLDRINRLESIVGQADPEKLHELDRSSSIPTSSSHPKQRDGAANIAVPEDNSTSSDRSKTPVKDTASRYLSEEFWGHLCKEVEGIKHALDQPSDDEDDEEEQYEESPESYEAASQSPGDPSGFIFGNPEYRERDEPPHPLPKNILRLWGIYVRNVDPLMKILHRPTLNDEIQKYVYSIQSIFITAAEYQLPAPKTALLFCIYFAAVSTLSQEQAQSQFGERKEVLVSRYRINAERALAGADYLNSNDLTTLQAATIYVTMLRCESRGRASWVLTSMIIRLAQAMNLHRDGDGHRYSPFEAEMRRRLWYFITVLDIRGAEDRGSDALLTPSSYNTIRPTNIDDDDFGPSSVGPLKPKATPADNVVCMCTARCSDFGYITHPHAHTADNPAKSIHSEDELIQYVRALENDFIHSADPSNLNSRYASEVARMVILKLWLIVQYPFSANPVVPPMRVSRETMLRTAVSVIELSDRMTDEPWKDRFAWWTRCYVQWHPLAVALAELCVQTQGELAERAWRVVERVYPLWRETVADSSKGPLWRPIRKLYKKAKQAKAEAMMKGLNLNEPPVTGTSTTQQPAAAPDIQPVPSNPQSFPMPEQPVPTFTEPFDSMNMDPSFLFQYPHDLSSFSFEEGLASNLTFDMAPWTEFLQDTQMDYSPGSGGGESI